MGTKHHSYLPPWEMPRSTGETTCSMSHGKCSVLLYKKPYGAEDLSNIKLCPCHAIIQLLFYENFAISYDSCYDVR